MPASVLCLRLPQELGAPLGTWLPIEEILNTTPQEGLPQKKNSPKPPRMSWGKGLTKVLGERDACHLRWGRGRG